MKSIRIAQICSLVLCGLTWVAPAQAAPGFSNPSVGHRITLPQLAMWERLQGSLISPVFRPLPDDPRAATALPKARPRRSIRPTHVDSDALHQKLRYKKDQSAWLAKRKRKKKKEGDKDDEDIKEEIRARNASIHQIGGFASLALLAASVVIGQINAIDFLNNRLSPLPQIIAHRALSYTTGAVYLATGILAWTLPKLDDDDDDDDKDKRFDSSRWHKILAWVHGFGMLGLGVSGFINARFIPSDTVGKTAFTVGHLALGYVTLAALATAMVLISFF